jgi:predicted RND superfamily exporter protein
MNLHHYYRRFALFVTEYPKAVIIAITAVTVLFGIAAADLKIDPDPWKMIPMGDPAVVYWNEVEALFGRSDPAIVAVVAPDTIYTPRSLAKVDELTRRLGEITLTTPQDQKTLERIIGSTDGEVKALLAEAAKDGLTRDDIGPVSEAIRLLTEKEPEDASTILDLNEITNALDPLGEVMGLSTVENIENSDGVLSTGPVMETPPTDADGCRLVREKVRANRMLTGKIVSEDETATIIFANVALEGHESRTIALYDKIKKITEELGGPETYYISGSPMIMSRDSKYMKDDMGFLIPLVILVIMGSLFLVFRNVKGMIQPMLVVLVSVVWTMGLMALTGVAISIVSSALPVILVAMGCAYGIHITTQFYGRISQGAEKRQAIVDTMEEITSPVIMTAVTSMVGYGSLVTSNLSPVREFGLFTTFGIFAAVLVSLVLIPAVIMIFQVPVKLSVAVDRSSDDSPIVRFIDSIGKIVIKKKIMVFAALVPAFILVIVLTTQVTVGYGFVKDFKKKSEIRVSDEKINEKFPGTVTFNVIIDSGRPDGAKDPEFLRKVKGLCDDLESDRFVGGSTSVVDFVSRMNYVLHDNDPSYLRLPDAVETVRIAKEGGPPTAVTEEKVNGSDLVAQYILLYENSGGRDIDKVVDFDSRKVNVVVYLKSSYSGDIASVEKRAMDYIGRNFTNGESAHTTGSGDLVVVISRYIIQSQLVNLATSLFTVLIMLMVVFKSIKAGIFSILPIVFTIFANFALMMITGTNLDVATAMIASMGLGDWIDFSIYFISIYQLEIARERDRDTALMKTLHNTGRPIFFNAVSVAVGFIVLMFSNFKPIMNIGWLVAATMLISAFATFVILPMVISRFGLYDSKKR